MQGNFGFKVLYSTESSGVNDSAEIYKWGVLAEGALEKL